MKHLLQTQVKNTGEEAEISGRRHCSLKM